MKSQARQPAWWAVARSEEVTAEKPFATRCGSDEVVLFRDKGGVARAFEDRCPHRRVPLSLGRVKDGALQCGYHGWTFEGGSGKCIVIPNLSDEERVPERHGVPTYPADERDGFVYVWVGDQAVAQPNALPRASLDASGRTFSGTTTVTIPHDEFVAALFDGPQILFDFPTVRLTDFVLGDPLPLEGRLTLDRGAGWRGAHLPDRFVPDWPLVFRIHVDPVTALTQVQVLDLDEALLISAVIAATPAARGATSVRWRCQTSTQMKGAHAAITRGLAAMGTPPLVVRSTVDGDALAKLRVGPSSIWRATAPTSGDVAAAA